MNLLGHIFRQEPRPIDNVSPRAQQLLVNARLAADRYSHSAVGCEHLLLGLLDLGEGVGITALKNLGVDFAKLRRIIEEHIEHGHQFRIEPKIKAQEDMLGVLHAAAAEAEALGQTYLGTEHVLLALLRTSNGTAAHTLKTMKIEYAPTKAVVVQASTAASSRK